MELRCEHDVGAFQGELAVFLDTGLPASTTNKSTKAKAKAKDVKAEKADKSNKAGNDEEKAQLV